MRNWSLGRRLLTVFAVLLGLVVVAYGVATWNGAKLRGTQAETARAAERVRIATRIRGLNSEIFGAERAIVVAYSFNDFEGATSWHERAKKATADAEREAAALEKLVTSDRDRRTAAELKKALVAWEQGCSTCHDEAAQIGDQAAMQRLSPKVEALVHANTALADAMDASQREQFGQAEAAAAQTSRRASITMLLVLAVSLVAGAGILVVVRRTNGELGTVATGLRAGVSAAAARAAQLAGSSQGLSQGAASQAASIEETSASMEEMSSMTKQNAANSQSAATLMSTVEGRVRDSNQALGEMVTSMAAIQESSQKVSKIIKTIDEIAFQTNILALNAAVEAARAGEAGMGFAVVADEVRNLAQRSATAARDTAALIQESIANAQGGASKVEHVGSSISGIAESVTKVNALVHEMSTATAQQAQGIDQVTRAVAEMEQVTQRTAATAEESAAISEDLNAQAQTSMEIVQRLEAMLGSRGDAAGGHGATSPRVATAVPATPAAKTGGAILLRPTGTGGF